MEFKSLEGFLSTLYLETKDSGVLGEKTQDSRASGEWGRKAPGASTKGVQNPFLESGSKPSWPFRKQMVEICNREGPQIGQRNS